LIKTIISCAIAGPSTLHRCRPSCPVTPAEIAESALAAAQAGAAIVHLHARDPETGKPVHRPEDFEYPTLAGPLLVD
jgi:uncharacterized protein (DUF849 family)